MGGQQQQHQQQQQQQYQARTTTASSSASASSSSVVANSSTTTTTTSILEDVIRDNQDYAVVIGGGSSIGNRDNQVYLGGSSIGKGLHKAARYYLRERNTSSSSTKQQDVSKKEYLTLPGAQALLRTVLEEEEEGKAEGYSSTSSSTSTSSSSSSTVIPVPVIESPFYILDLGVVVSQVYQWRKCFPRVEPFYAVKCNPDPAIVRTLTVLGVNFDCASPNEIRLVQSVSSDLQAVVVNNNKNNKQGPEIIYANPCKSREHLMEAVCRGVRMVTFDNEAEIVKIAGITKQVQLVLRIITDDRGSQCRLSSKFGAPPAKWRTLLATAQRYGLSVIGVSFHVGSGCRDATRYHLALQDARKIFDMGKQYGFDMNLLDIGGGFPGETHSLWNPEIIDDTNATTTAYDSSSSEGQQQHFMFFNEIAEQVAPMIDELFPVESGVRVIGEPGRFLVAACATLCCCVIGVRNNAIDDGTFVPEHTVHDAEAAKVLDEMTRDEEKELAEMASQRVNKSLRKISMGQEEAADTVLGSIVEELADYSRLFARQNLAQQEADVYNDAIDVFSENFTTASDILGPPEEEQMQNKSLTVEGMNYPLMSGTTTNIETVAENNSAANNEEGGGGAGDDLSSATRPALITLAAAGEAAVNGVVMQAVADSAPLQDDYAYYINDGVYGAFNNIMFDHATVRPRVLLSGNDRTDGADADGKMIVAAVDNDGFQKLSTTADSSDTVDVDDFEGEEESNKTLYATTVFGPTCDSIDVVARSVLLPKLSIGDWMYFQNMGAYTMAASSSFNGFVPSEKFYVCSVQPEYFESLVAGPPEAAAATTEEEKSAVMPSAEDEKKDDNL